MHKDVVNAYEVPFPLSDWQEAAMLNGFDYEYGINIYEDGSIEAEVHLSSPLPANAPPYLAALQVNNLNATRPDGYHFSHAVINEEHVHAYFLWTIDRSVV